MKWSEACEWKVIQALQARGWELKAHRHRIVGVELDLILKRKLWSLKSCHHNSNSNNRSDRDGSGHGYGRSYDYGNNNKGHNGPEWLVVEVKSLSHPYWLEQRVKPQQLARLRQATQALAHGALKAFAVELWLAFVPRDGGEILWVIDP